MGTTVTQVVGSSREKQLKDWQSCSFVMCPATLTHFKHGFKVSSYQEHRKTPFNLSCPAVLASRIIVWMLCCAKYICFPKRSTMDYLQAPLAGKPSGPGPLLFGRCCGGLENSDIESGESRATDWSSFWQLHISKKFFNGST